MPYTRRVPFVSSGELTYAQEVLADSPAGYWRMNDGSGTITDSSGNARDLATVTGNTYGSTSLITSDTSNKACTFASGYALGTYNPNLTTSDFTVEAWCKPSNVTGPRRLASNGKPAGGGWGCGINVTGNVRFTTYGVLDYDFTQALVISSTYHLVFVWNTTTKDVDLYVNGSFSQTVSGALSPNSTAENFRIGDHGLVDEPWAGVIDEVAFYSTALSAGRIAAHYAAAI